MQQTRNAFSGSTVIFGLALALLLSATAVLAATGNFPVSLTVSNSVPVIEGVNSSVSFTPSTGTNGTAQFYFNASDGNGASDLNDTSAQVFIEFGDENATSSPCTVDSSGNLAQYRCNVSIPYYYNASSSWTINVSVRDNSGALAFNDTETFTINTLKAISLAESSLSFSGAAGANNVAASQNPQRISNNGNFDFPELNLTGYEIANVTTILSKNFTVNVTSSGGPGQLVINATPITISNANMSHGRNANETMYLYLDIPSGTPDAQYDSVANWIVDVN